MRKGIIVLLLATTAAALVYGKTIKRRQLSIYQNNVPETETLADERMEFLYDFRWCIDTTATMKENYDSDQMLLQIGPDGLSKFSSFKNLAVDSLLMNTTQEQIVEAALEGKLSNGVFMTIFKNYPEGKLTHVEKICKDWFRYEEEMPELEWELADSTVNVLGYECHEAKCNFRGREWTAFYTEEIPMMDGPWKLHGLPGLIMAASDRDGEYTFECIGIKSNGQRPITIYKVPFNKTDRKGLYDAKNRFDINPYAYFETTTGGSITVTDEAGNPSPDAFDPMDLLYDYIERDWK